MQIAGFNFRKIAAERLHPLRKSPSTNYNIEVINISKEALAFLKEGEALKIDFKLSIAYNEPAEGKKELKVGEVAFEGYVLLVASKEELKDITKNWKKKEFPASMKLPLFNFILRKCSAKAIDLEEQLDLPPHVPIPQFSSSQNQPN